MSDSSFGCGDRLVVLDSCDHRRALKTFEDVDVSTLVFLNLTEKSFVKQHGVPLTDAELGRAHALARKLLEGAACSTAS